MVPCSARIRVEGAAPAAPRRRRSAALHGSLAMIAGLAMVGCARHGDAPAAAAASPTSAAADALPITVVPAAQRPTQRLLKFVGTLYGNEEVTLSSQVDGEVTALHADLGDRVTAGAVVLEIDDGS